MAPSDPRWKPLADLLTRVRADWPAGIWMWDERLECAVATISQAEEAAARSAITAAMPTVWTAATLEKAPDAIRGVAGYTGGLRGAQQLFTADLAGVKSNAFAYCLWWPWGSGTTFSARISAAGVEGGEDDIEGLLRSLLKFK